VSAILASSALTYGIVKYVGAGYLIWLGIRALRGRDDDRPDVAGKGHSLRRVYAQGVIVNVLNPKTALFFLAFLPQFVDVSEGAVPLQVVFLGITFILLGFVSDGTYALISARVSRKLATRRRSGAVRRWLPGLTLVGLGLVSALTGRRPAVT
jgi:threonine/homoserine/homoserine lactone efflux protein